MKKGINYIRRSISLDEETISILELLAAEGFVNSSGVIRQAIKEFYDKRTRSNGGSN